MKTGLGVHDRPVNMVAPRSCTVSGCYVRSVGEEITYVDWADEVLIPHQHVRHAEPEDDGAYPSADESFDSLFGRNLDKLSAAEGDAADVCEYVVGDDEGCREEEPNHAFEDVVHDEVCLDYDQVESHVRPGELSELEAVVALLEGADEEDEAYHAVCKQSDGIQGAWMD